MLRKIAERLLEVFILAVAVLAVLRIDPAIPGVLGIVSDNRYQVFPAVSENQSPEIWQSYLETR